ncbi:MAG TPA: DNA-formamidopyrimidine glycosylase family protein [Ilumatobacteraceae bacterium]|nr:DNA-formamidopyrimidine glycosylase family protein [Ilumatobacteraceae bacterium]HRB03302.1 DNA-formamidopyrimidine glycosylase family protein [Ilumatobacteraceae bacterium]
MPEGDTIRRLADKIQRRFAGQTCQRCVTRDPRLVGVDFAGHVLVGADAIGKHLLVRFDDQRTLHAHLLMTGSWNVGPVATEPAWRRRIELWMQDGRLTGLDVPILGVLRTADEHKLIGHLGPDLCSADAPDTGEIVTRMLREPDAPLAAALLDQRNVAGFGNLYAVELPFIVGVSPNQPVGTVSGLETLIGIGAAMIRVNARRGPQNTTGRKLHTDDHWIYPKRGRPCPVCGTRLDGWTEGYSPWGRVATWCPQCQPVQAIRAVDGERARRLLALHPATRDTIFSR